MPQGIEFLCNSAHGVYIPQIMVDRLVSAGWSIDCDSIEDLQDPQNDWYWETWDQVLNNAEFVDQNSNVWRLWQDGDLFAYCEELMTDDEKTTFFGEI